MAIDMNRMAAAALDAAVNGERPRRRFAGLKAVAAGAVLATVAREAAKRGPGLGHLSRLGELGESVRDRLADRGWIDDEPDEDEAYDEDEEFEDDDEPEAEADDDARWDDEDDDEDEDDEGDEDDEDDEPREDEDLDEGEYDEEDEDDEEDVDPDEDEPEHERSSAPPIARGNGRHVDPAARPPKPPEKGKSKAGRS